MPSFILKDDFCLQPNRTYDLEDTSGGAKQWIEAIEEMKNVYFKPSDQASHGLTFTSGSGKDRKSHKKSTSKSS